jgi:hypothetical protein
VSRGLVLLALALAVAALAASAARADGDPASDVLPIDPIYFPISAPSTDARSTLKSAVDGVYAKGDRLKVAVIATVDDLGAIPSLMNKPGDYAKFLGLELSGFYVGPLLIAMPHGWGIYDGGRSVTAEEDVLGKLSVDGSSVDDLVRSAAAAVSALEAAHALKSADIRAPWVYPETTTIRPGKTAAFVFRVLDDSNRASVTAAVRAGPKTVASLSSPLAPTNYPDPRSVRWTVPRTLAQRALRLCMTATDAAGNRSKASCVPLKVARR